MKKDLVSILDLTREDINELFEIVKYHKSNHSLNYAWPKKSLALIFEKPSLRTRLSFEVAMTQLDGHTIYFSKDDIQLGKRESIHDVAKTLSGQADAIAARTFKHETILELAKHADIPVINALSDKEHPCQALADFLTIKEHFGTTNIKFAYVGDGNNVCHSLMLLGALLGADMRIICPPYSQYRPKEFYIERALKISEKTGARIFLSNDLSYLSYKAIRDADVIYTDTWISMGQEEERKSREVAFATYHITKELLKNVQTDYQVMHCLPAHRGEEITDEVMDDKEHSLIWKQAENRLHIAKALLFKMLNK